MQLLKAHAKLVILFFFKLYSHYLHFIDSLTKINYLLKKKKVNIYIIFKNEINLFLLFKNKIQKNL